MWKLAAWLTKQVYVTGLCPNLNNWPIPFIDADGNFVFNFGRAFVLWRSTRNKSRLQKVIWTSLWRSRWWDKGQSKEITWGMRLVNIGRRVLSCLICLLFLIRLLKYINLDFIFQTILRDMPRTYALPPGNCMSKTHALPPGNCTSKMSHLVSPKLVFLTLIFLHPNKQVGRLVPEVLPSNPHSHHRSGNHGKCFLYKRTRRVTIKTSVETLWKYKYK